MTISIKPTASGSTIEQDGSTILTVDGSGNLSTPNNLTVSGAFSASSGAGKILQVVHQEYSTSLAITSSSWVSFGLTASITPSSTSSKILVMVLLTNLWKNSNNAYYGARLYRDATIIQTHRSAMYTQSSLALQLPNANFSIVDSPSTTSSITYSIQLQNEPAVGTITFNGGSTSFNPSTMILMEIAG